MRSRRALTVLLSLAAAVAAVPSTASAGDRGSAPGGERAGQLRRARVHGRLRLGQHDRPRRGAVRHRWPGRSRAPRRPETGSLTTFVSGLPPATAAVGIGGAMDVAFLDGTAYVLVTLVGSVLRTARAWSMASTGSSKRRHPDPDRGHRGVVDRTSARDGLLRRQRGPVRAGGAPTAISSSPMATTTACCASPVAGDISQMKAFGNIVPTGLEVRGETIYMGEAGPIPHLPQNGKVVSFTSDVGGVGRGPAARA